jgi:hypothetical protein
MYLSGFASTCASGKLSQRQYELVLGCWKASITFRLTGLTSPNTWRESKSNSGGCGIGRTNQPLGENESQMPPPPPKPLGNLKGNYAIETDFPCCEGHSDRAHDALCHITLSPDDDETMRGQLQMGNFNDYKILMFFETRPIEVSSEKVWFTWRGRKGYGSNRRYRGDENHGWVKFRGNGEIEVWFDKVRVHLIAQKGRALGDKNKHNMHSFWDQWHEYDEDGIDLLDTSKLFPDW